MEWLALVALGFVLWFLLVVIFSPRIDYRVTTPLRPDSEDLLRVIQATCQAAVHTQNHIEILTNGERFYPAIRDAIGSAQASVNLEAYMFDPGEVADSLIDVITERARAGVEVRVVLDALGSLRMRGAPLARLRSAGCQVYFYQSLAWHRLHRLNNRTHRELLVVDGRVAFTGGAGIADWWIKPTNGDAAWRDTMTRIEGPIVGALQGVFAENWLECCGEILTSRRHWPVLEPVGSTEAMLVKSSPADRATVSRVVFQMLMEGATRSVHISTPYFLPDRALRRVLVRAVARGVSVSVLVPGRLSDQRFVRFASRRLYGELLEAGVRIHEYRPAMTHVKALMVDDTWAVIGTTNVDNRSFEHNDEVNVALHEARVTARLQQDFEVDLEASDEITLDAWRRRPRLEKLMAPICSILERQQ